MKSIQIGRYRAAVRDWLWFSIPTNKPVWTEYELDNIVATVFLEADLTITRYDALWLTTPRNQARATDEHGNEFQLISKIDLLGNLAINVVSLRIATK